MDKHIAFRVACFVVLIAAIIAVAIKTAPAREAEREHDLQQRMAECRSLGGSPVLEWDNMIERFYLDGCHIK